MSKNRHLADADQLKWASQSFGKTVSEAPMRWHIKRCGYAFYKSRSKQSLTTANTRRSVEWSKSHLIWNLSQWEKVLWTNEPIFKVSYWYVGRKVFIKKDKANDPSFYNHVVCHPSSVMMWLSIAANGDFILHFCRDMINAQDYMHLLNMNLQPSVLRLFGRKRYLFQHNNRRPHTAKITQTYLKSNVSKVKRI